MDDSGFNIRETFHITELI